MVLYGVEFGTVWRVVHDEYLQADAVGEVQEVLPEDAHLSSQSRLATQVVFDKTLHNWNYVVSPYLSSHVIF